MKLWIDDVRPAPDGYIWCKSTNEAKETIKFLEDLAAYGMFYNPTLLTEQKVTIDLIDIDHDAGDYVCDGGDYYHLLDWLEETRRDYPIRIHSMNPVGVQRMREIIQYNGWQEVR